MTPVSFLEISQVQILSQRIIDPGNFYLVKNTLGKLIPKHDPNINYILNYTPGAI